MRDMANRKDDARTKKRCQIRNPIPMVFCSVQTDTSGFTSRFNLREQSRPSKPNHTQKAQAGYWNACCNNTHCDTHGPLALYSEPGSSSSALFLKTLRAARLRSWCRLKTPTLSDPYKTPRAANDSKLRNPGSLGWTTQRPVLHIPKTVPHPSFPPPCASSLRISPSHGRIPKCCTR